MRRLVLPAALLAAAACATVEPVQPPEPPRLEGAIPAIGRRLDLEVEGRGTPVRLRGVTGRVTAVCVLGSGSGPVAGAAAPPEPEGERPIRPAPEAGPMPPASPAPEAGSEPEAVAVEPVAPASDGEAAREAQEPEAGGAPGMPPPEREAAADAAPVPAPPPAGEIPQPPARREAPRLAAGARQVLDACQRVADALEDRIAVVGLTTDPALDLDAMPMRTYRDPGGKAIRASLELEDRSQVILVDQQGRVAEVFGTDRVGELDGAARRLAHQARKRCRGRSLCARSPGGRASPGLAGVEPSVLFSAFSGVARLTGPPAGAINGPFA